MRWSHSRRQKRGLKAWMNRPCRVHGMPSLAYPGSQHGQASCCPSPPSLHSPPGSQRSPSQPKSAYTSVLVWIVSPYPKFLCWSPNPQDLTMWPHMEISVFKEKTRALGGLWSREVGVLMRRHEVTDINRGKALWGHKKTAIFKWRREAERPQEKPSLLTLDFL